MLKGNRLDIFAVGLAAIIAFTGAWLLYQSASLEQGHYQRTADKYANQYADEGAKEAKKCVALVPAKRPECQEKAIETARNGQRDEYDLEAQRVTAIWTQHMGIAAMIGMAVGIVGIGLVWSTFRETRRSADAAIKSYEAFVKFETAVIEVDFVAPPRFTEINGEQHIYFNLKLKNIGRSPALIETVYMKDEKPVSYQKLIGSSGELHLAEDFVVKIPESKFLQGCIDYVTSVSNGTKRTFHIETGYADGRIKATIHPGYVVQQGDEGYENPFD